MDQRKKSQMLGALLAWEHPKLFSVRTPTPLGLGIHKQITTAYQGVSSRTARLFLRSWCSRTAYHRAVAAPKSERTNLDYTPAGPVSDEHREAARLVLEQRDANKPKRKKIDANSAT